MAPLPRPSMSYSTPSRIAALLTAMRSGPCAEGRFQHQHATDRAALVVGQEFDGVDAPASSSRSRTGQGGRGHRALGQLHGGADPPISCCARRPIASPSPARDRRWRTAGTGAHLDHRPAISSSTACRWRRSAGAGDAADLQAFALDGLETAADDLRWTRRRCRSPGAGCRAWRLGAGAQVHQARLLAPETLMPRLSAFPPASERPRRQQADGWWPARTRWDVSDALAEPRQAASARWRTARSRPPLRPALQACAPVRAAGRRCAAGPGCRRHHHVEAVEPRSMRQHVAVRSGAPATGAGERVHHEPQILASSAACAECGGASPTGSSLR